MHKIDCSLEFSQTQRLRQCTLSVLTPRWLRKQFVGLICQLPKGKGKTREEHVCFREIFFPAALPYHLHPRGVQNSKKVKGAEGTGGRGDGGLSQKLQYSHSWKIWILPYHSHQQHVNSEAQWCYSWGRLLRKADTQVGTVRMAMHVLHVLFVENITQYDTKSLVMMKHLCSNYKFLTLFSTGIEKKIYQKECQQPSQIKNTTVVSIQATSNS